MKVTKGQAMLLQKFNGDFEKDLIGEFESSTTIITSGEKTIIIDIGQPIRIIPLLVKGVLKIVRMDASGDELFLYYVYPNESCAMTFSCCVRPYPSEIRVIAETDVDYIAIPVRLMDEWMGKYSSWRNFVMKTIHARFNELLVAIDQLAFQKLDERLINYLNEKSTAVSSTLLNISHEEIANDLASSREVVSRLLKKLENEKKILLYRNQIKLLRPM